jgi:beta-xylosidase
MSVLKLTSGGLNSTIVSGSLGVFIALLFGNCVNSDGSQKKTSFDPSPAPDLVMGTATNPIIKGDVPDISTIRVGDVYYMVSTTMYYCPAVPIMKSYDLINWKIVSYCTDIINDIPAFRLETQTETRIGAYAQGQWAASLRYFDDRFWVLHCCNTDNTSYLYTTSDPEYEPWTRHATFTNMHDGSLFYDEVNDRVYVIYSAGETRLQELDRDLKTVKGSSKVIIVSPDAGTEGSQVYYKDGYYWFFFISYTSGRREFLYRSTNIEGPYEKYPGGGDRSVFLPVTGLGNRIGGVAQGGPIDTPNANGAGDWYAFFFQDRDAVGRVPVLIPMTWEEGEWPHFDKIKNNNGVITIPLEFDIMMAEDYGQNLYVSDEFDGPTLPLAWQWNHNPINSNWSLTARPGYLRLTTCGIPAAFAGNVTIFHARNTLTQRTFEPACEGTVALEPVNMKDGDIAGLAAFSSLGGFVGIEQEDGKKYIVMYTANNDSSTNPSTQGNRATETRQAQVEFNGDKIYLRVNFRFRGNSNSAETANFQYSLDKETWQNIGTTLNLRYTLQHFTGYRFGLFNYAKKEAGGHVDFDYFHVSPEGPVTSTVPTIQ